MYIVYCKDWNVIYLKSIFKSFISKILWLSLSIKLGMGGLIWFLDFIKYLIICVIMDK